LAPDIDRGIALNNKFAPPLFFNVTDWDGLVVVMI
jgi:hypothetical protein